MPSIVVGTAGHVDHGKSTLVKALTGTDPDRLKEEQARGITIDLGFAHVDLGGRSIAFVDVPGHERFVRNMLAGAGGVDAVLLVVAADESVMPQTREHYEICRLLGVERGVIALTKTDLVDADAIEIVTLEVREMVAGRFLGDAPIVPVSARTGAGLDALSTALAALPSPRRASSPGVVRVPIDRAFAMRGFGPVVTGTLVSGTLREGDDLSILPVGHHVRARGVQVHGSRVATASAPARVAVNVAGIDVADVGRGMTLAAAGTLAVTRRVDARLTLLASAAPLPHAARVRVHVGTSDVSGRVAIAATRAMVESTWRAVAPGERAPAVPSGGASYVRIRFDRPIVTSRFDRGIVRAFSPAETIGGFVVLDPEPPSGGLRRDRSVERFRRLDLEEDGIDAPVLVRERATAGAGALDVWLEERGVSGLDTSDLVRRGGLTPSGAAQVIEAAVTSGRATRAAGRVIASTVAREIDTRVVEVLDAFHRATPHEPGLPSGVLRDVVSPHGPAAVVDARVAELIHHGVVRGADRLSLTSHVPTVSATDALAEHAIEESLRRGGLTPPDPATLPASTGVPAETVDRILRSLTREGRVVRLGDLVFARESLARLRADVEAMKGAANGEPVIDVGTFKQRHGLSRKFAIPLLEWLDRERVTRRVGDKRIVR
jgi:selenocysteine-specific elongation factor